MKSKCRSSTFNENLVSELTYVVSIKCTPDFEYLGKKECKESY